MCAFHSQTLNVHMLICEKDARGDLLLLCRSLRLKLLYVYVCMYIQIICFFSYADNDSTYHLQQTLPARLRWLVRLYLSARCWCGTMALIDFRIKRSNLWVQKSVRAKSFARHYEIFRKTKFKNMVKIMVSIFHLQHAKFKYFIFSVEKCFKINRMN